MNGPAIEGLPAGVAARWAVPDDAAAITEIITACEAAHDGVAEIDLADVEQWLNVAGEKGTVVLEDGVRLVGWATVLGTRAEADVDPDEVGRGLGSALLAWTEERGRELGETRVRQTVSDADPRAAELFRSRRYEVAYSAWPLGMAIGDTPPEVHVPAGIAIRAYEAADARAVYGVIEEGFSALPGRGPQTFERWREIVLDHPAFSPAQSRVALDGDRLVGASIAYDYGDETEGWVQQVATASSHRRRGIGRALIESSFAAFHAAGRRQVGLSTDSRTGALDLYERIGLRAKRSFTAWTKELSARR
jgi:mycothiol synthase